MSAEKSFLQINSWCLQGLKKFLKHFHYSKLMIGRIFRIIAMRERNFHDCATHQCIFNCANVPYCSFWVFTITQTTKKLRIAYFAPKKHIGTPLRMAVEHHWYIFTSSKYVESIPRGYIDLEISWCVIKLLWWRDRGNRPIWPNGPVSGYKKGLLQAILYFWATGMLVKCS